MGSKGVKQCQVTALGDQQGGGGEGQFGARVEVVFKLGREWKVGEVVLHSNVCQDQFDEDESDVLEGCLCSQWWGIGAGEAETAIKKVS